MDLRGLERDLRKLPGVVACAIAGDTVSILLSGNADRNLVGAEAAEIARKYGAPSVRILESPDAAVTRRVATPMRARVAIGTAVAAAIAVIASLVPVARKVAPKPPAAIRPASASDLAGALPPIMIPQARPLAAPRHVPTTGGPVAVAGRVGVPAAPAPASRQPVAPVNQSVAGPTEADPSSECGPPGDAQGRHNHEGEGNQSRHRHQGSNHSHYEHWFDCT